MSLASLLLQTSKHLLYRIFHNVGECTGHLYSAGSSQTPVPVSRLGEAEPVVVTRTAQLVQCSLSVVTVCVVQRAGTSGRAGSRCVVSTGVVAAGRRAPVPPAMLCVLCREDQEQASPQYLRCGGSQTWNILSCVVTL